MKYLFSVLDKVSGVYAPPFVALSAGAAKRQFMEAVNTSTPDNQLNKYHDDFSLVYFGEFDEIDGVINPRPRPEHVCNGADVYRPVPPGYDGPVYGDVKPAAKDDQEPELPL